MKALVLAFDGLVAETIELRAEALQQALAAEGIETEQRSVLHALPGRTLHEAISALVGDGDQTLIDLAALRAQQEVSTRMAQGVSLAENARVVMEAQRAAGTRLVLRADSLRRDVERVLQLTDLEFAFAIVRCADDLPRMRGVSTLEGSYAVIGQRLEALRVTERAAMECSAYAAGVASRTVGRAEHVSRLRAEASGR